MDTGSPREPLVAFGKSMRDTHFLFASGYTPLNHGSYGAFPISIRDYQRELQDLTAAKPDTFIRYNLPQLLEKSRAAIAPLLGVAAAEVVFLPNATTGINTVLRNLSYNEGDVVLYFSTIYGACEKTIDSVCETTLADRVCIQLDYPIEDKVLVEDFRSKIQQIGEEGRRVKIAIFDTVLTFPGVRMPWENLVHTCKDLGVLSLIDGAHGVGHIDLTHLGKVDPDFFTSNCYKWLYVPRGCAVFYVPTRNQHLIRTSLPTSHGFRAIAKLDGARPTTRPISNANPFVELFAFVATVDTTPYMCIPEALHFREEICGGEEAIRSYCQSIVQHGASLVAEILGTEIMENQTRSLQNCCFANVRLPFVFASHDSCSTSREITKRNEIDPKEAVGISKWIMEQVVKDYDSMMPINFRSGALWVRFSGQIYVELKDFEWAADVLRDLCNRVIKGEGRNAIS